MDVYKKVNILPKYDISELLKVFETATKVLSNFCYLNDNRTYMLMTNRIQ